MTIALMRGSNHWAKQANIPYRSYVFLQPVTFIQQNHLDSMKILIFFPWLVLKFLLYLAEVPEVLFEMVYAGTQDVHKARYTLVKGYKGSMHQYKEEANKDNW